MTPHILVVDDEKAISTLLSDSLVDEGFSVSSAQNGFEALKKVEEDEPDLVLLDIVMQGLDGIETLKEIKKTNPNLPVIIISSYGNIDNAVYATKLGAYDFIEKPLTLDKTLVTIKNALDYQRVEEELRFLKKKNIDKNSFTGNSNKTLELKGKLFQSGLSDDNVLITGEHGTGKKLAAKNIHFCSKRSEFSIAEIHCGSGDSEFIRRELFGCSKDYSDAGFPKIKGNLELCDGGTVFLNEITELDVETQKKLVEFIDTKKFSKLGDAKKIKVDVRIIASTSKNMDLEMKENRFSEELLYRLNTISVDIPPLRERKEDIPMLLDVFLDQASSMYNVNRKKIHDRTMSFFMEHDWPGNVRELKNIAISITLMNKEITVTPEGLPSELSYLLKSKSELSQSMIFKNDLYEHAMKQFQELFVLKKLAEFDNDIEKTSVKTGLSVEFIKGVKGEIS